MKKLIIFLLFVGTALLTSPEKVKAQIIVKTKPLTPKTVIVKTPTEKKNHFWISGHWIYSKRKKAYEWKNGHWVRKRKNYSWQSGQWIAAKEGYKWIPGHWKRAKA